MTLVELRCPSCNAPVDPSAASILTCRYCGATMEHTPSIVSGRTPVGHTVYFLKLGRIGPSNRPRVAKLLNETVSMKIDVATKLLETYPNEIPFDIEETRAKNVATQIIEAGGQAEVVDRFVVDHYIDPPLPEKIVHLDAAGAHHVAVIKVVHEFMELGMLDAKALVDSAPCVLTKSMEGARAKSFQAALVAAGATARIA